MFSNFISVDFSLISWATFFKTNLELNEEVCNQYWKIKYSCKMSKMRKNWIKRNNTLFDEVKKIIAWLVLNHNFKTWVNWELSISLFREAGFDSKRTMQQNILKNIQNKHQNYIKPKQNFKKGLIQKVKFVFGNQMITKSL